MALPDDYAMSRVSGWCGYARCTGDVGQITHPVAVQKLHLLLALHPDAERKTGVGVDHFA